MNIEYIVADPAGNITGLVMTAIAKSDHKRVARYLLEHSPHGLEQVGFVSGCRDCDGTMDMMGGEFCGNASRSFGLYLASRNLSRRKDVAFIRVSGAEGILEVRTNPDTGEAKIKMPPVMGMEAVDTKAYGRVPMVVMEGIRHLILIGQPVVKTEAEDLIRKLAESQVSDALGIMYYDEASNFMTPLVWVRETDTMYWESSCGSGSVALAEYLTKDSKGPWQARFHEPGGSLKVERSEKGDVFLGGPVSLSEVANLQIPWESGDVGL